MKKKEKNQYNIPKKNAPNNLINHIDNQQQK